MPNLGAVLEARSLHLCLWNAWNGNKKIKPGIGNRNVKGNSTGIIWNGMLAKKQPQPVHLQCIKVE